MINYLIIILINFMETREMDSKNGSANVDNGFFKVKRKRDIRSDILNLLRETQFGLNVSQIADQLELSRNTVKSYLARFEQEGLIQVKEIGRAKMCFLLEPQTIPGKKQQNPLLSLTPDFFNKFLIAFDTLGASQIKDHETFIKQVGAEMAPLTTWPSGRILPPAHMKTGAISIGELKDFSLQFIGLINALGKLYHAELDPAFPTPKNQIIRMKITDLREKGFSKLYGWIWAGLIEAKLQESYSDKIYLDMHDYQEESSSWSFELGIRD